MSARCEVERAGTIALFYYGEIDGPERRRVERHLNGCAACRQALGDLATIGGALATIERPSSPPGGDWAPFMSRLDAAIRAEPPIAPAGPRARGLARPARWTVAGLGLAAALVLATMSVLWSPGDLPPTAPGPVLGDSDPVAYPSHSARGSDPVLAAVGGQHFARSKLVVLGLATRDATVEPAQDWSFERDLAASLLNDTRLYRMAAEDRGMTRLAGVMRDLELVLLETSMTPEPDRDRLEQVQRLIRRRDLVTKLNAAHVALFD